MELPAKIVCEKCGTSFERAANEVRRNKKKNRRTYCSAACSGADSGKWSSRSPSLAKHLKGLKRKPDQLSPFRHYVRNIRDRNKTVDVTANDLRELWISQNGRCPFTGWTMTLPLSVDKWPDELNPRRGSLDRIDSSKGYVVGNIQFVCYMANVAKNMFSDEDLKSFCIAVSKNSGVAEILPATITDQRGEWRHQLPRSKAYNAEST